MHEFRRTFPNVNFTLEERLSSELIELVRGGRVDVAFLWTPRADGLVNLPLLHEPLVVALPQDTLSLNVASGPIPVKILANETFIVYGRRTGFGLYASTIIACRAAGFSPKFGQESPLPASALKPRRGGALKSSFVPSSIQSINMHGVAY